MAPRPRNHAPFQEYLKAGLKPWQLLYYSNGNPSYDTKFHPVTKAYGTDLRNGRLHWKARVPACPDSSHLKPLPYHSKAYVHHTANFYLVQL